ncbi:MAG: polysaccharide export protein EpsE [Roseateles sp.]|nr:MAG: polysaccharide export protein EpsE [Roseateles sp.]
MMRLYRLLLVSLALALGLAQAQAQAQSAATPAANAPSEYRLGAGDAVRVLVYQNPDLTLETRVAETGVISFPLIGNVRIGGLSVSAAEQLIADGLRNGNFVKQPQVTIVLLQIRGNQASVLGQVNRPGRYPIETTDMRLTDLLATAGGVAPTGADLVVLTGTRGGKPYRLEVDLPSLFSANSTASDVLVQNGDVLWVDRSPLVYIYGEVQRPGPMRLERGMTLMQGLAAGGGLTQRGTERGIRVHRKAADGSVQVEQLAMDAPLKEGDVVFVRESLF